MNRKDFTNAMLPIGVGGIGIALLGACAAPPTNAAAPAHAITHGSQPAAVSARTTSAAAPAASAPSSVSPAAPVAAAVTVAPSAPPISAPVANSAPTISTPPNAASPDAAAPTPAASASSGSGVSTSSQTPPHFDTPEAAMRYLVAAYNNHDIAAEMHVTTPDSRDQLENERQWVKTFAFDSCTPNQGSGDYTCEFDMVTKVQPDDADTAMGEITVIVAPAQRPGWYVYADGGCGGG